MLFVHCPPDRLRQPERVLRTEIESRRQVEHVGTTDDVEEQVYAISIERRITHSCLLAITRAARGELFRPGAGVGVVPARASSRRKGA